MFNVSGPGDGMVSAWRRAHCSPCVPRRNLRRTYHPIPHPPNTASASACRQSDCARQRGNGRDEFASGAGKRGRVAGTSTMIDGTPAIIFRLFGDGTRTAARDFAKFFAMRTARQYRNIVATVARALPERSISTSSATMMASHRSVRA